MFKVLVGAAKRHGVSFVFEVSLVHEYFPGTLLEEIHFGSSEVELIVFVLSLRDGLWGRDVFGLRHHLVLLMIEVTLALFLDGIIMGGSHVLSNEEALVIILLR